MGTYVTYVTSHLFDMPEMQEYANERLKKFYEYTQEKGGFSEYNSPTYSIVAIDELNRMQRHIVEPEAKRMIDELYVKCWHAITIKSRLSGQARIAVHTGHWCRHPIMAY